MIFDAGSVLSNEDLAVMLASGGGMLRLAGERMSLASVDDVLATVMVVGDKS
ncbi:hypothetical protein [Sphingomonas sp.]|uniref:hypothetical protein n=1 Tax=Sphingomonas sp. TaxID=28214 RepID=UPI003B00532C